MPKRDQNHMEMRRRQIMDAALECFVSDGFQTTTMKQIGERAGVSIGGLYTHFKNKQEVMLAVLDYQEQWRQSITANSFEEFQSLIYDIASDMVAPNNARHQWNIQAAREALADPGLRQKLGKSIGSSCTLMLKLMSELQRKGEIRPEYDVSLGVDRLTSISLGAMFWNYHDENMDFDRLKTVIDDELARMKPTRKLS